MNPEQKLNNAADMARTACASTIELCTGCGDHPKAAESKYCEYCLEERKVVSITILNEGVSYT